jgi:1-acyl-sn-glycerol-3-phosphate acyltransferase
MFMTANYFIRTVLIFKRGAIRNKARFNAWIDRSFANSPQTGLAVYPEGHRSTNGESLPLKRGMLHYAYDRKLPTQVVIGANKEAVLSERHCTARLGQTIAVGFSGAPAARRPAPRALPHARTLCPRAFHPPAKERGRGPVPHL